MDELYNHLRDVVRKEKLSVQYRAFIRIYYASKYQVLDGMPIIFSPDRMSIGVKGDLPIPFATYQLLANNVETLFVQHNYTEQDKIMFLLSRLTKFR